ncbi:MAG: hypothetical protein P4L83_08205 [Nevskia sp.]|nr:hypothetical protein [Nevskia sp.]
MAAAVAALAATLAGAAAHAELEDEIQVYTDDINKPGEFHLELHVNNTPEGRSAPDYPGEVTPNHGTRINPEFSYGLTDALEAGMYIPTNLQSNGAYSVAGSKLRLKWMPVRPGEHGGWYAGENVELSDLAKKYSESRLTMEFRTIGGYHDDTWLIAFNPIFDLNLSPDTDRRNPDFNIGLKVSRRIFQGVLLGPEYYSDFGHVRHFDSWGAQNNMLYLVTDVDRGPLPFQFGVGRGLTPATDKWTVKAIFEIPFD